MSTNTKRILTILAVAIFICILGGAAAIGGIGLMANRFKDNVTMDKTKVQKMAQEFIHYELPANYAEQIGMDFIVYKMVLIGTGHSTASPMIFLAHFESTNNMSPEQMSQQMQKSAEQQSGTKGAKLKLVETRKVTINGHEATLAVNEGDTGDGETLRQWVTAIPGKTGFIVIMIQGSTDGWDDAVFNEFLASISN